MTEHLDNKISQKIKDILKKHVEDYEKGAWERFLKKRKEKKKRILLWRINGLTASFIMSLSIGISLWTHVTTPVPIESKVFNKEIEQLDDSFHPKKAPEAFMNELSQPISNSIADYPKDNIVKGPLTDETPQNSNQNKILANLFVKYTLSPQVKKPSSGLTFNPQQSVSINSKLKDSITLSDPYNDVIKTEEIEGSKSKVELGLLISPSYGISSMGQEGFTSSEFAGGLAVNISFNQPNLFLYMGAIFTMQNIEDRELLKETIHSSQETENLHKNIRYGLNIPLNFSYYLPINNSRFFLQAGVSSYLTLKQKAELSSTIFREVIVYHEKEGHIESYMTSEIYTTTTVSDNDNIKFTLLNNLNFSIGYRALLTDRLSYEIQPFYKYPIHSSTEDGEKIHTAGISFKIILSK
ncbi:hypothetical protein [Gelidibacter japonicus]|uniref:hypothetical protein n=1 Tax=Gelidibacter japonicus TaxID=1962232 RepID=UPI002AFEB198|nr:hypothetical protein [Gelidibacter japonicus]